MRMPKLSQCYQRSLWQIFIRTCRDLLAYAIRLEIGNHIQHSIIYRLRASYLRGKALKKLCGSTNATAGLQFLSIRPYPYALVQATFGGKLLRNYVGRLTLQQDCSFFQSGHTPMPYTNLLYMSVLGYQFIIKKLQS